MTPEQEADLWRWAVHNKSFEISRALTELRSTMMALGAGNIRVGIQDHFFMSERQLKICELEVKNLQNMIMKIRFTPSEEKKDDNN